MSALISEEDLNDFISPALACIKPTQTKKVSEDNDRKELQVGKEPNELEKVSITLQDCLACAGCITSSEEVLLSRQSHTVFMETWKKFSDDRQLAVSIAPQSRISLANYYNMPLDDFDLCLLNLFKRYFRCRYFVGTQMGRNITINRTNQMLINLKNAGQLEKRPKLSAVCPGFVLYAEKTKPELVPLLLNIKSPQQITGSLLKDSVSENEKLYHLAIMPCFDKKLEASRPDGESEVDCVITPKELVTMLQELQVDFYEYRITDTTILRELSPMGWEPQLHWSSNDGSSSGGYAYQYVLGMQLLHPGSKLSKLEGKNSDVMEYRLIDDSQETVKVIASASELYGFRNIQNMVRRLEGGGKKDDNMRKRNVRILKKRKAPTATSATSLTESSNNLKIAEPYSSDFIEVMACPGGCINGGGLINGEHNSSTKRKMMTEKLNERYSKELICIDPITIGKKLDENSKSGNQRYEYYFNPIKDEVDQNIVSVSNAW